MKKSKYGIIPRWWTVPMCMTLVRMSLARVIIAALLLVPGGAMAGDGRELLQHYLDDFSTLKAQFTQMLIDEKGRTLETSNGIVYLSRPGKFRWDYKRPYEQSIISDGLSLWIYDQDLEQVTIRDIDKAMGGTPAALLGRQIDVDKEFIVTDLPPEHGFAWIGLQPRGEVRQYDDIQMAFDGGSLRIMLLKDNLGQITMLRFSDEIRGATLDPALFSFVPPEGIDVLDQRGQ